MTKFLTREEMLTMSVSRLERHRMALLEDIKDAARRIAVTQKLVDTFAVQDDLTSDVIDEICTKPVA